MTNRGGPHRRFAVAFAAVVIFLLFVLVLLPFAVTSVVADVADPQSHRIYDLTPDGSASATGTYMHVEMVSIDEWARTVTLRISGQHICPRPCAWTAARVSLVSIPERYAQGQGLPPAEEVLFLAERAQPVNQTVTLPVDGEPVRYPFDRYRFTLGFLLGYVYPEGTAPPAGPPEAQAGGRALFVSARMTAPRMTVSTPRAADPARLTEPTAAGPVGEPGGGVPLPAYVATAAMTFSRPLYLRVLTVLLVLLVTAAAAYAVFLRPLNDLMVNAGALVLGVWGIRAVLLGADVPGLTAVDLALSVVILFLLLALTGRTVLYLHTRSGLPAPSLRTRRGRPESSATAVADDYRPPLDAAEERQ